MDFLSLADGISCGYIAAERARLLIDSYHAYEIAGNAINVSQWNYPKIRHMGNIIGADFTQFRGVDILLGGTPCQGFSYAGDRLNFNDPRSLLFFEYARALNECWARYFLYENVPMDKASEAVISAYLGVEPIVIDSGLLSAQKRIRLYWTNIPNITQPEDASIKLNSIIAPLMGGVSYKLSAKACAYMDGWNRWDKYATSIYADKSRTVYANFKRGVPYGIIKEWARFFTPLECELLQGLPPFYTDMIPTRQRYEVIGNAWQVDTVAHILKHI